MKVQVYLYIKTQDALSLQMVSHSVQKQKKGEIDYFLRVNNSTIKSNLQLKFLPAYTMK